MHELILYLQELNDVIERQMSFFTQFLEILDKEEDAISHYDFQLIEKSVIVKDQHIRMAQNLENKRLQLIQKISYLIAFDSRRQTISLDIFCTVFTSYLENVRSLLPAEVFQKVEALFFKFKIQGANFKTLFETSQLRVQRNKQIIKKILQQVELSQNIFHTNANTGINYNAVGKPDSKYKATNSSVRVMV